MMAGAREHWTARWREREGAPPGVPSPWVVERALGLRTDALVIDLAAGRGRHAVPLARAGRRVVAVDVVEGALREARTQAPLDAVVADAASLPLRDASVDAILCVSYLDRALFPHLHRLLRAGGLLIVETFTADQRALGRGPSDPAHLLEPGELSALLGPLRIVERSEGLVRDACGERYVARAVGVNDG